MSATNQPSENAASSTPPAANAGGAPNQTPSTPPPASSVGMGTPATPPASTPPAGASASDWTSGLNDDMKGYVQNKGFKDPSQVIESYQNIEKLMGVPKDRLLKLPDNLEDPQAMGEIYQRLGRPTKPEEYKIATEGMDPDAVKALQGMFFENGLTGKQAQGLVEKMNAVSSEKAKARQEAMQAKTAEEETALKREWGAAYEQKVGAAKRAVREFGVKPETIDKLEQAMGFGEVMRLFDAIGSKMLEPDFHTNSGGNNFMMTPAAAQNKINALKQDREFYNKLSNRDANAVAEWDRLHRMAAGMT